MKALQKKVRLVGLYTLPILMAVAMVFWTSDTFSGTDSDLLPVDKLVVSAGGGLLDLNGSSGGIMGGSKIHMASAVRATPTMITEEIVRSGRLAPDSIMNVRL